MKKFVLFIKENLKSVLQFSFLFLFITAIFTTCVLLHNPANDPMLNSNLWYWATVVSLITIIKIFKLQLNVDNYDKRFSRIFVEVCDFFFVVSIIIFSIYLPKTIFNFLSTEPWLFGSFLENIGSFSIMVSMIIICCITDGIGNEIRYEIREIENERRERAIDNSYWFTTIK